MSEVLSVRVVVGHDHSHDEQWNGYHEWVYIGPFKGDSLGRQNPRILFSDWQKWRCNNGDCPAWAVVNNRAIADSIEAHAPARDDEDGDRG